MSQVKKNDLISHCFSAATILLLRVHKLCSGCRAQRSAPHKKELSSTKCQQCQD